MTRRDKLIRRVAKSIAKSRGLAAVYWYLYEKTAKAVIQALKNDNER